MSENIWSRSGCERAAWSRFLNQIWSQKRDRGQHKPFICRIRPPVGSTFGISFGSENWTKYDPNSLQKMGSGMQPFSKFFCSISARRSTERCRRQNEPFIPAKLVTCRHTFFLTRIVCLHWHRPLAQNIPRAQVRFGFRLVVIIVQWRGIRLLLSLILTAVAKPSSFVIIRLHSFQSNSFFFSPPHSSQVTFLRLHSSSFISTHRHSSSSIFNHLRSPSLMPIHFTPLQSSSCISTHLHSSPLIPIRLHRGLRESTEPGHLSFQLVENIFLTSPLKVSPPGSESLLPALRVATATTALGS